MVFKGGELLGSFLANALKVHLTNAKLQWGSSESPCDMHVTTQEIHSDSSFCKNTLRQKETWELPLLCILSLAFLSCINPRKGFISMHYSKRAEQSSWWARQARLTLQSLSVVKVCSSAPTLTLSVVWTSRQSHMFLWQRTWSLVYGKGWLLRNSSTLSTHTLYSLKGRIK